MDMDETDETGAKKTDGNGAEEGTGAGTEGADMEPPKKKPKVDEAEEAALADFFAASTVGLPDLGDDEEEDAYGEYQEDPMDLVPSGKLDIVRSEEHTSELQSLMRISYAVFCLKKKHNT